MVLNLAKSPLTWSIGGVGAIAIALIGLSYLSQNRAPAPEITLNNLTSSHRRTSGRSGHPRSAPQRK
ncbi:MAG TPA: hypothetical protein VEZ50_16625 [Nodosilinea sp.]|nr:hypothetical protein [Nodosilinea sp.]